METVTADALIQVDEILRNQGRLILWATVIIAFLMLFVLPNPTHRSSAKVPTIKFVSMLLPEFLSRLLFNSSAATVIYKGYQQVSNQILSHLTIEGVLAKASLSTKIKPIEFSRRTEISSCCLPNMRRSYGSCLHRLLMPWKRRSVYAPLFQTAKQGMWLKIRFQDHVGDYTTILTDSHLHTETIQKRLTPAIGENKLSELRTRESLN
jgi:hypothetical protein